MWFVISFPSVVKKDQNRIWTNCEGWAGSSGGGVFTRKNDQLVGVTLGSLDVFTQDLGPLVNVGQLDHYPIEKLVVMEGEAAILKNTIKRSR